MTALAAAGAPARLGKYEILSALAAGGMARLYVARTTGIGSFERHVVLKLLLPERAHDEMAVGMFLDEARLAAALHHQNVAQVFEVGEELGQHYLAMEYVHGQDLRALLAKAGATGTKVPPDLALTIVVGAAAGLHHAHERRGQDGLPLGIVHRDVSPSNVMVAYDGGVKLLDFGIAKATSRTIETQSGVIKGKFAYMSPEQCRGRPVDARSDGFALGIILYEVTTQHRCFRADSDFDTMHRIVTGDVTRPSKIVPGYPPELEAIVLKSLSVDAAQRYQSVGEFMEAIEQYAASARLALSTSALGRFMRELFGDVPEPWLTSQRTSAPIIPRESTISSTSAGQAHALPSGPVPTRQTGSARVLRASEPPQTIPTSPAMPMSAIAPPATIPDPMLQSGDNVLSSGDWNAKSYPATPPSAIGAPVPETTPFRKTGGIPVMPARRPTVSQAPSQPPTTTERGVAAGFAPAPSSQSHSAIVSIPPSQQLGIPVTAQPQSQLSYPRYEPPPADEDDEPRKKPSRGPLYLAIGAVGAGLAVAIVLVSSHGSSPKDKLRETVADNTMTSPSSGSGPAASASGAAPSGAAPSGAAPKPVEPPGASPGASIPGPIAPTPAPVEPPGASIPGPVAPTPAPVAPTTAASTTAASTTVASTTVAKADSGAPTPSTPSVAEPTPAAPPKPADRAPAAKTVAPEAADADDAEITVHVVSEPAGAEVSLAGKSLGTTPLDTKLHRATGSAMLVIHRAKYADVTAKLDLDGDFSKDVALRLLDDHHAKHVAAAAPATPETAPPPAKKCQPAGQVNPFDTSCNGQPCPPCK
ncbi:MAG TPA: protein kinase [Kofleriaceae bacterium]